MGQIAGRHLRTMLSVAGEESPGENLEGPETELRVCTSSYRLLMYCYLIKSYNHPERITKEKGSISLFYR